MNRLRRNLIRCLFYLPFAFIGLILFVFFLFLFTPSPGDVSTPAFFGKMELVMAQGERSILLDENGYADWIAIDEVPENILQIIIGVEDFRFLRHFGIDVKQVYYTLMGGIRQHDFIYGGSTITRQLARIVWLDSSRSPFRRLLESTLAISLEKKLPKQEILEWYINAIEMAPGIRGLRAGARYYFAKEPAELSFKEQLFLAAIIHDPSRYTHNAPLAYERMQTLAQSLFKQAKIPAFQANALDNINLSFAHARPPAAPQGLRSAVQALWPRDLRRGANLRIEARFDSALQERLEGFMIDLRASGDEVFVYAGGGEGEPRALVLVSHQGAERMRAYARTFGNARLFFSSLAEAESLRAGFLASGAVRIYEEPIVFSEKKILDMRYALGLLPKSFDDASPGGETEQE
jgi:membrane peptidoglycan carboxypeptidase